VTGSDLSLFEGEASGPIRVLHVDYNPQLGRVFRDFLQQKSERIEAKTVADPSTALETVLGGEVDCVVSDYDMPEMDGIELLEAIRADCPDLPFFLFTGQGSEEVASDAIAAGATGYLRKGRGTDQYAVLANRVENAVEQYRTKRAAERTERHVRELMENTPDVRWMFTADWSELLFVNSSYEDIYGRSVAELKADPRSFLDTVHPDDRDHVEAAMGRLSDGESVRVEYRADARTDYGRWIEVRGRPIWEGDEVRRVVGYSREVTERMRREQNSGGPGDCSPRVSTPSMTCSASRPEGRIKRHTTR
jgi:PAS domain S-box